VDTPITDAATRLRRSAPRSSTDRPSNAGCSGKSSMMWKVQRRTTERKASVFNDFQHWNPLSRFAETIQREALHARGLRAQ
jgi:hypothetical protein